MYVCIHVGCVCMYVCMYVGNVCMYTLCCVCVYVCMYVRTYVHTLYTRTFS